MTSSQQGIPRKFSEKIAILARKQNEEEEQFHNVMRDVRALTSKAGGAPPPQMNSPEGIYTLQSSSPNAMQRRCNAAPSQVDEEAFGNGGGCGVGGPPQAIIVGAPPHPLLPMQWNRSLPNVHQSLATNPNEVNFNNWNQWQSGGGVPAQHHARTRSPGSSHAYHPYSHPARAVAVGTSSAGGSPRQGGQPCSESHIQMMMPSSIHHLQLPDPTWSKARSDPTININSMAASTSTMMMSVPPGCFNSSNPTQHMHPQQQQQQWSAPQQQQQAPLTSPIVIDYPMFNGSVMSPSRAAVPYPVPAAQQQHSPPFQYPPSTSYRTYQSQQEGILSQYPVKCYPVVSKGPRDEASIPELDNKSLDISMGSLPNMHAQVPYDGEINTPPMSTADRYRDSRSPSQPMPVDLLGQATWTMEEATVRINHQQQQQQQQQQPQVQQQPQPQGMRTGSLCQPSSSQQLSTPMLGPQSQSAPTSPSLTTMDGPLLSQHQWPPNRHFSASPTSPDALDIPNIVLTGPGGTLDGANFDCFHDLKDLHIDHLDNEIQRLLSNPGEGAVDPAIEQLLD